MKNNYGFLNAEEGKKEATSEIGGRIYNKIFMKMSTVENLIDIKNGLSSLNLSENNDLVFNRNYIDEKFFIKLPISEDLISKLNSISEKEIKAIVQSWLEYISSTEVTLKKEIINLLNEKNMLKDIARDAEIYCDERLISNEIYCIQLFDAIDENEDILDYVLNVVTECQQTLCDCYKTDNCVKLSENYSNGSFNSEFWKKLNQEQQYILCSESWNFLHQLSEKILMAL